MSLSTAERLKAHLGSLSESDPRTEEERLEDRREAMLLDMQEPSGVTVCRRCGEWAYMIRLGCPNPECPDQPFSVDVEYRLLNYQGQFLVPRQDFMYLEWRPLTAET